MRKSYISFGISILLLVSLIYFSGVEKVIAILMKTDLRFIVIGCLLWVVSLFLRVTRWKILLENVKCKLHFSTLTKVFVVGLAISNISPGKIGDPVRGLILKKVSGVKFGNILPSIFVERLLDVICTILFSLVGIFILSAVLSIVQWFVIAIAVYIVIFSFLIFILLSQNRTDRFVGILIKFFGFLPKAKQLEKKTRSFSSHLHKSFLTYKNRKVLTSTFFLSLLIWFLEGFILYTAFLSLHLQVDPMKIIFVSPIIVLLSILTFLPGGLGSGDILSVIIFSSLLKLEVAQVTSAVILARFLSYWPYVFIGMFLLTRMKYRYKL
jgi:uncharacterized protein (TIRG00374 family)